MAASDFDAAKDAVPLDQLFEIDRWALARAAEHFQAAGELLDELAQINAAMLDAPRPTPQTLKNCRRFISIGGSPFLSGWNADALPASASSLVKNGQSKGLIPRSAASRCTYERA